MPVRCDTAWGQETKPLVTAMMALPPKFSDQIGRVIFRVSDLSGASLVETVGEVEKLAGYGGFSRLVAKWPVDHADPGRHHLSAIVLDKNMRELCRVAPRMVSVRMQKGY